MLKYPKEKQTHGCDVQVSVLNVQMFVGEYRCLWGSAEGKGRQVCCRNNAGSRLFVHPYTLTWRQGIVVRAGRADFPGRTRSAPRRENMDFPIAFVAFIALLLLSRVSADNVIQ